MKSVTYWPTLSKFRGGPVKKTPCIISDSQLHLLTVSRHLSPVRPKSERLFYKRLEVRQPAIMIKGTIIDGGSTALLYTDCTVYAVFTVILFKLLYAFIPIHIVREV